MTNCLCWTAFSTSEWEAETWVFMDQWKRINVVYIHLFHWLWYILHREWNAAFWLITLHYLRAMGQKIYSTTERKKYKLPQVVLQKKVSAYAIVQVIYQSNHHAWNHLTVWERKNKEDKSIQCLDRIKALVILQVERTSEETLLMS